MPTYIRNKQTGIVYELPYDYTDKYGNTGVVKLRSGKLIHYISSIVSNAEDTKNVKATLSVANTFVINDGGTPPDPDVLNCAIEITVASMTKTNLGSDITQFKLFLNKQNFPIQVNTDLMGGLVDDTFNNEIHGTFQNISPQSDGSYLINCISTGLPNVIYLKYTGCSNFTWVKYTTFEPDTESEGGGGEAIVRTKPIVVKVWGNGGHFENSTTTATTYNNECWMLSQPQFRHLLPFYGSDIPPTPALVNNYDGSGAHIGTKTVNVTVSYFTDASVMNQMIDYTVDAGLQGFCFLFYPENEYSELIAMRVGFNNATNKRGLKTFYGVEDIGGGYEVYPNTSYNYTVSVNHIADQMGKDYWMRIDNKPVLLWRVSGNNIEDTTSTNHYGTNYRNFMFTTLARIKAKCTELYPSITQFHVILEVDGYNYGPSWLSSNGFESVNWYYSYPSTFVGNDFYNMIEGTNTELNRLSAANVPVSPPITCGMNSTPRIWHLYNGTPLSQYLTESSVYVHLPALVTSVVNFMNSHSDSRIGFIDMADENTEQSEVFFPTKRANGTINDNIQKKIKQVLNP